MAALMAMRSCGPRALMIDCGESLVFAVTKILVDAEVFTEVIPSEQSVMVMAENRINQEVIRELIAHVEPSTDAAAGRDIEVPMRYDGIDLMEVAKSCNMSIEELIRIHSETTYRAVFAGFAPGFMYCATLPQRLQVPRRQIARLEVPAGSVAIADVYTAVYPRNSPGGWNLIGTTNIKMFDAMREPEAFLQPGDMVRFVKVP